MFFSNQEVQAQSAPAIYVDLFLGTDGHGHTSPAATVPFGMIQPGPVNGTAGWDWVSGYHYSDSLMTGFAQTHLSGTGIGDLNDILIMPFQGEYDFIAASKYAGKKNYTSRFSHDQEEARPGYYAVNLLDSDIYAEMTATERTAMYRFSFPDSIEKLLIVDLGFSLNWDRTTASYIQQVNDTLLVGYRYSTGWAKDQKVYFAMTFDSPVSLQTSMVDTVVIEENSVKGTEIRSVIAFHSKSNAVQSIIAISSTGIEGAMKNMNTQTTWNFDEVAQKASDIWNEELSQITIEADSETKTKFYTALYRTKLAPYLFSDVDGRYRGAEGNIHKSEDYQRYTVYSLWDTFRAQHPLLTLKNPERVPDMVQTMLDFYGESGLLPVWELHGNETNTMTGYHAVPVIADAFMKGFKGLDAEIALEAMEASAMQKIRGTDLYREYGYIPSDLEVESVTKTLEYAFDDWSIAMMAKMMGKKEKYEYYLNRSGNWRALYDTESGFMRGKNADGTWVTPFDPLRANHRVNTDYTEGNAWQHSWFVPHDVSGLIQKMGGDEAFVHRLDSMFSLPPVLTGENISPDISGMIGQYAHGNEPSHHIAYLYNDAGMPWKTQMRVHQIMDSLYTTGPNGLSGNEDCGQMSAWYVFSALGFYPVNPVGGVYVIGSPAIEKATIRLASGKSFGIIAHDFSKENIYIQSANLNGKPLNRSYLLHEEIVSGGVLEFHMGDTTNKEWAREKKNRPSSYRYP